MSKQDELDHGEQILTLVLAHSKHVKHRKRTLHTVICEID